MSAYPSQIIGTKNIVYELPSQAFATRHEYSHDALNGIRQQAGVWFPEPVHEICIRSERPADSVPQPSVLPRGYRHSLACETLFHARRWTVAS